MGWVIKATPRLFTSIKRLGSYCTGCWVGPRIVLGRNERSLPYWNSIPEPFSPQRESLYQLSYPSPHSSNLQALIILFLKKRQIEASNSISILTRFIIIIIIIIIQSLVRDLFSLVLLLNQRLRLLVSECSVARNICDVPSTAVFFLANLLNISLVWLSNISLNLMLLFRWLQLLPV